MYDFSGRFRIEQARFLLTKYFIVLKELASRMRNWACVLMRLKSHDKVWPKLHLLSLKILSHLKLEARMSFCWTNLTDVLRAYFTYVRHKLECLSLARLSSLVKCLRVRPVPTRMRHLSGAPLQAKASGLPWSRSRPGTKALAYWKH